MEISTDIAARVSAYFNGWVDPEAFAKSAEKGAIYQQRHYLTRDRLFSFYVLNKDNQRVPIEQLTSINRLGVVLAHDSVVPEMLVLLSNIEHARGQKEGEDVYEVQVVSQVGTDNTTREAKYACISFKSTEELASKIIAKANKTSGDQEQRVVYDIGKLTIGEIHQALRQIFEPYKKYGVTLSKVKEFSLMAKKYNIDARGE